MDKEVNVLSVVSEGQKQRPVMKESILTERKVGGSGVLSGSGSQRVILVNAGESCSIAAVTRKGNSLMLFIT